MEKIRIWRAFDTERGNNMCLKHNYQVDMTVSGECEMRKPECEKDSLQCADRKMSNENPNAL